MTVERELRLFLQASEWIRVFVFFNVKPLHINLRGFDIAETQKLPAFSAIDSEYSETILAKVCRRTVNVKIFNSGFQA
jgi:hypothetical protein